MDILSTEGVSLCNLSVTVLAKKRNRQQNKTKRREKKFNVNFIIKTDVFLCN